MDNFQRSVIGLVKSAITFKNTEVDSQFDWARLMVLAKYSQTFPLVYYGVKNSQLTVSSEILHTLEMAMLQHLAIDQRQLYELKNIELAFQNAGIDYMLLKGARLKYLYPETSLRVMSDADILIKEEQYDKIKSVMLELGFSEAYESNHEFVWKKSTLVLELHKSIVPSYNIDFYNYFGNGWRFALENKHTKHRYTMSKEDEFIYIFTHFADHYRNGGIGIRHITDLWIYLNKNCGLDESYIEKSLKELQIFEFYQNVVKTINVWFENANSDEITDIITNKIFTSGSYGTAEQKNYSNALRTAKKTNTVRFVKLVKILNLFFPPIDSMKLRNPILKRAPILLPVYWIIRWFDILLFKREKIAQQQIKVAATSQENVSRYQEELKKVGLDFNFEEK